jgi:hypothetical protein
MDCENVLKHSQSRHVHLPSPFQWPNIHTAVKILSRGTTGRAASALPHWTSQTGWQWQAWLTSRQRKIARWLIPEWPSRIDTAMVKEWSNYLQRFL